MPIQQHCSTPVKSQRLSDYCNQLSSPVYATTNTTASTPDRLTVDSTPASCSFKAFLKMFASKDCQSTNCSFTTNVRSYLTSSEDESSYFNIGSDESAITYPLDLSTDYSDSVFEDSCSTQSSEPVLNESSTHSSEAELNQAFCSGPTFIPIVNQSPFYTSFLKIPSLSDQSSNDQAISPVTTPQLSCTSNTEPILQSQLNPSQYRDQNNQLSSAFHSIPVHHVEARQYYPYAQLHYEQTNKLYQSSGPVFSQQTSAVCDTLPIITQPGSSSYLTLSNLQQPVDHYSVPVHFPGAVLYQTVYQPVNLPADCPFPAPSVREHIQAIGRRVSEQSNQRLPPNIPKRSKSLPQYVPGNQLSAGKPTLYTCHSSATFDKTIPVSTILPATAFINQVISPVPTSPSLTTDDCTKQTQSVIDQHQADTIQSSLSNSQVCNTSDKMLSAYSHLSSPEKSKLEVQTSLLSDAELCELQSILQDSFISMTEPPSEDSKKTEKVLASELIETLNQTYNRPVQRNSLHDELISLTTMDSVEVVPEQSFGPDNVKVTAPPAIDQFSTNNSSSVDLLPDPITAPSRVSPVLTRSARKRLFPSTPSTKSADVSFNTFPSLHDTSVVKRRKTCTSCDGPVSVYQMCSAATPSEKVDKCPQISPSKIARYINQAYEGQKITNKYPAKNSRRNIESLLKIHPYRLKGSVHVKTLAGYIAEYQDIQYADPLQFYDPVTMEFTDLAKNFCDPPKPHIFARDLMYLVFTIGDLSKCLVPGTGLEALDQNIMAAIKRETINHFSKKPNYSEISWEHDCKLPLQYLIKSLFFKKMKESAFHKLLHNNI